MEESLIPPTVIVGEAVAGEAAKRAAKVRIELEHLNAVIQDSNIDIGGLLYEVKAAGYYGSWGYSTFEEYVTKVLDMSVRTAQYLVSIVRTTKELGIPREQYENIAISKLREIASLDPKEFFNNPDTNEMEPLSDHVRRLVKDAGGMSVKEIVDEVKRLKNLVGDDELVNVNLKVKRSVRDNVIVPAQEKARQILGSRAKDAEGDPIEYSTSQCEDVIHSEFLTNEFDEEGLRIGQVDGEREVEPDEII